MIVGLSWEAGRDLYEFGLGLRGGVVICETGGPRVGGGARSKPVSGMRGAISRALRRVGGRYWPTGGSKGRTGADGPRCDAPIPQCGRRV